jgi:hypothetical protein
MLQFLALGNGPMDKEERLLFFLEYYAKSSEGE